MKIWAKTAEFSEGKFLVVRRDGTVPAWPHFVLGALDPAAPAALRAYADTCEVLVRDGFEKIDPAYIASIRELSYDFERYRAKAGTGDADAAPHRTDDPNVIQAMRGEATTIAVRPGPNVNKSQKADPALWDAFLKALKDAGGSADMQTSKTGRYPWSFHFCRNQAHLLADVEIFASVRTPEGPSVALRSPPRDWRTKDLILADYRALKEHGGVFNDTGEALSNG